MNKIFTGAHFTLREDLVVAANDATLIVPLKDHIGYIVHPGVFDCVTAEEYSLDRDGEDYEEGICLEIVKDNKVTYVRITKKGKYNFSAGTRGKVLRAEGEYALDKLTMHLPALPIEPTLDSFIEYYFGDQLLRGNRSKSNTWTGKDVTMRHSLPKSIPITYYKLRVIINDSIKPYDIFKEVLICINDQDITLFNHPTGVRIL